MRRFVIFCFLVPWIINAELSTPDESLKRLLEGNQRYVSNTLKNGADDLDEQRKALVSSQKPFAIVVGCSDSRVPPEIIFDQGLGDLFVVRVAGNVVGPIELDSIEFAVDQLLTPLVLVLGHQGCGAVKSVLLEKKLDPDLAHIEPFIQEAIMTTKGNPGDPLKNAIVANVRLTEQRLKANSILRALIKKGRLKVVGGYYQLSTGKVDWID